MKGSKMLGCFKPDFSSLTKEEKEHYKTLHCSMCKSLKKQYGTLETLFLNYDLDFIFLVSQPNLNMNKVKKRCTVNPLKTINTFDYDFSRYSNLNIIFIYVALLDKKFDGEFSRIYKITEKLLNKSIEKAKKNFNETLETDVFLALNNESNLDYIGSLYKNLIINHLKLDSNYSNIFKEMIKIMYYFDSFKDYFDDLKTNKFNVFSKISAMEVPQKARELIIDSIWNIKSYIPEDSINYKTLEFSLQSKFNKLNAKFSKNKRRYTRERLL